MVSPIVPEENVLENLPVRPRDNRLPAPGSILTKTYRGKTIEVKVLENGFEYEGKVFKSISRVAMPIVKRQISGYVFFGLTGDDTYFRTAGDFFVRAARFHDKKYPGRRKENPGQYTMQKPPV